MIVPSSFNIKRNGKERNKRLRLLTSGDATSGDCDGTGDTDCYRADKSPINLGAVKEGRVKESYIKPSPRTSNTPTFRLRDS